LTEPTLAYFDTNVFDNLLKKSGGVTDTDEQVLRRAIEDGRLVVLASILNVEETLAASHSRKPEIVLPQLRLISNLADWSRFVKPCDIMVTDDIRHFAWNGEADIPFLSESTARQLRSAVERVLNDTADRGEIESLLDDVRGQKERFLAKIINLRTETMGKIRALEKTEQVPNFYDYFQSQVETVARDLAKRVGVESPCEARGIEALLKVRSVRITAGLGLSFIYRTAVEGKKPRIGISRDLQHASVASAADVFITHDRELGNLLQRVPMKGFKVATLGELLRDLALPT
jgi:hypothetical protein